MASRCAEGPGPHLEGVNGSAPPLYGCFWAARRLPVQWATPPGPPIQVAPRDQGENAPGHPALSKCLPPLRKEGVAAQRAAPGRSSLRCSRG
ncbi:hypothetical protein NDU88_001774 [Pleurodeles waltl]|uniref:Uncharacterized protein n=1 Tax=Pleurodeles waltl TaxID=8319 RepID=A0AAV7M0I0_PLEWA|nr:hypothetical protein NDU88_001774 [Pleurodeles waltl]